MHILQLCPRVPYPPHDGGAIAMYETARGLAQAGHRVTVLAINTPKHHQPADALAHLGPNVRLVTVDVDTRIRPLAALRNLAFRSNSGHYLPYNVERFISIQFADKLKQLLLTESFDVLQLEGTFVAWYAGFITEEFFSGRMPQRLPLIVLRAHNVEYTIWEMLASRATNPLKKWYLAKLAHRLEEFERWMLFRIDAVAAITEADVLRLQRLFAWLPPTVSAEEVQAMYATRTPGPPAFACIPASYDLSLLPAAAAPPQPRTVFVIGSLNWLPNIEGLAWFLKEVWPQAHAEMPDLALHIAGSYPPADLTTRPAGQDNVFIHGFVASAPAFMQQYELMLVPLLSGGGMRVKMVEGLALGKPILSTALGAEGIAARDGENLLLRDGAAAWLQALRDYYHGRLPLAAIGQAAAATAHTEYDTRQVTQRLLDLYETLLSPPATVPQP
jgi:glycosyltransferase involved in cell wall biosynthesis